MTGARLCVTSAKQTNEHETSLLRREKLRAGAAKSGAALILFCRRGGGEHVGGEEGGKGLLMRLHVI